MITKFWARDRNKRSQNVAHEGRIGGSLEALRKKRLLRKSVISQFEIEGFTINSDGTVSFTFNATSIINPTNTNSEEQIEYYQWSFGDGNATPKLTDTRVTHVFNTRSRGIYTITLGTFTNDDDKDFLEIAIDLEAVITAIKPSFLITQLPEQDTKPTVQFRNTSVIPTERNRMSLTYQWDFGDGTNPTYSREEEPIHTYTRAGTYNVTLTVTDTSKLPVDVFTISQTIEVVQGVLSQEVTFDVRLFTQVPDVRITGPSLQFTHQVLRSGLPGREELRFLEIELDIQRSFFGSQTPNAIFLGLAGARGLAPPNDFEFDKRKAITDAASQIFSPKQTVADIVTLAIEETDSWIETYPPERQVPFRLYPTEFEGFTFTELVLPPPSRVQAQILWVFQIDDFILPDTYIVYESVTPVIVDFYPEFENGTTAGPIIEHKAHLTHGRMYDKFTGERIISQNN
jgi:PKD repeat protein